MPSLPLPLLVALVLADHEHPAVPPDDLALLAHRLDRRSYLHVSFQTWYPGEVALEAGAASATTSRMKSKFAHARLAALSATTEHSNPDRGLFGRVAAARSNPSAVPLRGITEGERELPR
jgi:hypothetical protein